MALSLNDDVIFEGPALPEAFVRHELEKGLGNSLPKEKAARPPWEKYRRAIRQPLTGQSGRWRVKNVVLDPLAELLGYEVGPGGDPVVTREGAEGPGLLLRNGAIRLRAIAVDYQGDLDAPAERGQTYRFTPQRIAQRLLAGDRRARGPADQRRRPPPDAVRPGPPRLVDYLQAQPLAVALIPRGGPRRLPAAAGLARPEAAGPPAGEGRREALEAPGPARRRPAQAGADHQGPAAPGPPRRRAVPPGGARPPGQSRAVRGHDAGRARAAAPAAVARGADPGLPAAVHPARRGVGGVPVRRHEPLAAHLLARLRLADVARQVLDRGADSGHYLEQGLRKLFEIFEKGLHWREARIDALGGRLFGREETPLLSACAWSELGCARLLDKLLWTLEKPGGRGRGGRGPTRARGGGGSTTPTWTSRTWAGSTRPCWSWSRAWRPSRWYG